MKGSSAKNRSNAEPSTLRPNRLGTWVVVTSLSAFLVAASIIGYLGWTSSDTAVPTSGYVAMALGVIFSVVVCVGLMALIFFSSRRGYDEGPVLIQKPTAHRNKVHTTSQENVASSHGKYRMTTRWILLVAATVLFGLFSMSFGKTMRLDRLHGHPSSAPAWSDDPAPFDTNRLALVIGNSNYPDGDFPFHQMTRDAESLANALRKDGFQVEAVDNATRSDMTGAIDRLIARVHSNSIVLVYFGGYGVQSDDQNYLIPVDGKIWNEEDVRREGVSLDRLLSKIQTSGARIRLVVIEAERRNPYERRFRVYSRGLAPIQTNENTLVLSSASPGHVVEDSNEQHSQLMTALLTQMNSSKGIEDIFKATRDAVAAATRGQQAPTLSSTLTENVNLRPPPSATPVTTVGSAASGRRG